MKKVFVLLIVLIFCSSLHTATHNMKGNNIIWSPVEETLFLYSVYGKSSGTTIWKVYDLLSKNQRTIYYGNSLLPQWSFDGKSIVFSKKNVIQISSEEGEMKDYTTSVADLVSFDYGVKGDKIVYSNGEKIYILELKANNNYFVVDGANPSYINNDKKIIYFDKDLKVNLVDETLKSKVIISNMVKKIYPFKKKDQFLYQEGRTIKLYDLSSGSSSDIVNDKQGVLDFEVSYDNQFITYQNNKGEHYIVHVPTHLKVKVLTDKKYFSQKLSNKNKYACFQKSGEISIRDIKTSINAFGLKNIYKLSIGKKDGLQPGISLEIYQEKKNPFTDKVIGYDEQGFKGTVKVIAVYAEYSYGMIDKEFSSDKPIEVGDAVLWKAKDKLGSVLKK